MSGDEELMELDYDDCGESSFLTFALDTVSLVKSNQSYASPIPVDPAYQHTKPLLAPDCRLFIVDLARASRQHDFTSACADDSLIFSPRDLGFIPAPWPDHSQTFGELVSNFFRRRSSASTRFLHKLVNAIKIVEENSACYDLVGVAWVTSDILRVDKIKFARLLGVRTIDPSLFHKQGNFPTHGFVEVCCDDAHKVLRKNELKGVDFDVVRLVTHAAGAFTRQRMTDIEEECRWKGVKKESKRGADAASFCDAVMSREERI
jgi:hypothetical protein